MFVSIDSGMEEYHFFVFQNASFPFVTYSTAASVRARRSHPALVHGWQKPFDLVV
jgi:hypothetical protein